MNRECDRSADQLASTIEGEAWYGDSLREILAGVSAEHASVRPIGTGHTIWEIVAHLDAWIVFFSNAIDGVAIPPWKTMPDELDWPPIRTSDPGDWQACVESFFRHHIEFVNKIRDFGDARLQSAVPGREYDFSRMFHSASLHAAYHAGQIALLKKMLA